MNLKKVNPLAEELASNHRNAIDLQSDELILRHPRTNLSFHYTIGQSFEVPHRHNKMRHSVQPSFGHLRESEGGWSKLLKYRHKIRHSSKEGLKDRHYSNGSVFHHRGAHSSLVLPSDYHRSLHLSKVSTEYYNGTGHSQSRGRNRCHGGTEITNRKLQKSTPKHKHRHYHHSRSKHHKSNRTSMTTVHRHIKSKHKNVNVSYGKFPHKTKNNSHKKKKHHKKRHQKSRRHRKRNRHNLFFCGNSSLNTGIS